MAKTVFVTGATSGIGLELCKLYLEKGYRLLAHYRTPSTHLDDLVENYPNVKCIQIDFSDTLSMLQALEENKDLFQSVDIFINLAAYLPPVSFAECSAEDLMDVLKVNTIPGILLMQKLVPIMMKKKWGRIVHASSIGVKFGGGKHSFTYSFSKHALEFIPADYKEWAKENILVNVLRIGVTNTKIHSNVTSKSLSERSKLIPMGRVASPVEMAKAIFWYASEENSYTTGQVIAISGGE